MASFHKCGARWFAQVNKAGVRKSHSFDTKAAARQWVRQVEMSAKASRSSGYVARAVATFSAAGDVLWLQALSGYRINDVAGASVDRIHGRAAAMRTRIARKLVMP